MWELYTCVPAHTHTLSLSHTHTQSRNPPPSTPINKSDDNNHPGTEGYERSGAADLRASIPASHLHPPPSSLELSKVSLLQLGREAQSWLADRVTTTRRCNKWRIWEIPGLYPLGRSGWMASPLLTCCTASLKNVPLVSSFPTYFGCRFSVYLFLCLSILKYGIFSRVEISRAFFNYSEDCRDSRGPQRITPTDFSCVATRRSTL